MKLTASLGVAKTLQALARGSSKPNMLEHSQTMYAAALIDEHPIVRMGLARILASIPDIHETRVFDPLTLAPERQIDPTLRVRLLLFGIPSDAENNRLLLDRAVQIIKPDLTLLLGDDTDNMPIDHPTVVGRIRKSSSSQLIEAAIKLVLAGGSCFPYPRSNMAAAFIEEVTTEAATPELAPTADRNTGLSFFEWPSEDTIAEHARRLSITPRHYEILLLRAHGLTPRGVGQMLGISEATVKSHASAMYRRLRVTNYQEAVVEARRRGVDLMRRFLDEGADQRR